MKKTMAVLLIIAMMLSITLVTFAEDANTEITVTETGRYQFRNFNTSAFQTIGSWTTGDGGLISSDGLLFIKNEASEYTITLNAILGTGLYTQGTSGGYGILFETTLTNDLKDTGFSLQFDRGYSVGGIIIRPRVNGAEFSPIKVVTNADNAMIPASKNDSWWTEEHSVELVVSEVEGQEGKKSVSVSIDGQNIISNFVVDSSVEPSMNHTGLRSWQAETIYKDMVIETKQETEIVDSENKITGLRFEETFRSPAGRSNNTQVEGDLYFVYDNGSETFIESTKLTFNGVHTSRTVTVEAGGVEYSVVVR